MPQFTDSSGEIEIVVTNSRVGAFSIGDRVALIFRPIDEPNPPYKLKVTAPSGATIVDTIIRSLPTGEPQSAPPFEFSPSVLGLYKIDIREMNGRAFGTGKLKIG